MKSISSTNHISSILSTSSRMKTSTSFSLSAHLSIRSIVRPGVPTIIVCHFLSISICLPIGDHP